MSRTPFIAGNWKMSTTPREAEDLMRDLVARLPESGVDIAVAPPFTSLPVALERARDTRVLVFAQNMHEAESGAFTGEVSAPMLTALGVQGVILGHSERREHFGETDRAVGQKLAAAFAAGLQPILCVGETDAEHERGETDRKLRSQVREALHDLTPDHVAGLIVAYEPIWAIGTGRTASPEQAQEAIGFIRALVGDRARAAAESVRVLYGGSVKAENAGDLLAQPDIDGALVGGASLDAEGFVAIVEAARR